LDSRDSPDALAALSRASVSTLADLHAVLQIGFDWTDFHLHRFRIRKKDYAVAGSAATMHGK
jgi:hypothetical protein